MIFNKKYRCRECDKFFDDVFYYEEKHGLDTPPYERIAVCPYCKGGDFAAFDFKIDKLDVAEKILPVISGINRYLNDLAEIYGEECKNLDLQYAADALCEFMSEMFDFVTSDIEKRVLKCSNFNEEERILLFLKGEI